MSTYNREWYLKNKDRLAVRFKERNRKNGDKLNKFRHELKCTKCNDDRWYILEFHHQNPEDKEFTVGSFRSYSTERIKKEIEKCVPLCANCHREFHYLKRTQNINLEQYLAG